MAGNSAKVRTASFSYWDWDSGFENEKRSGWDFLKNILEFHPLDLVLF
jgi:hypothetical protein